MTPNTWEEEFEKLSIDQENRTFDWAIPFIRSEIDKERKEAQLKLLFSLQLALNIPEASIEALKAQLKQKQDI